MLTHERPLGFQLASSCQFPKHQQPIGRQAAMRQYKGIMDTCATTYTHLCVAVLISDFNLIQIFLCQTI
eukprot:m.148586 g.148586  ORF g.148586 m.148586 type:complete len:69 (-) comp13259_c0_seq12:49-255(-)